MTRIELHHTLKKPTTRLAAMMAAESAGSAHGRLHDLAAGENAPSAMTMRALGFDARSLPAGWADSQLAAHCHISKPRRTPRLLLLYALGPWSPMGHLDTRTTTTTAIYTHTRPFRHLPQGPLPLLLYIHTQKGATPHSPVPRPLRQYL